MIPPLDTPLSLLAPPAPNPTPEPLLTPLAPAPGLSALGRGRRPRPRAVRAPPSWVDSCPIGRSASGSATAAHRARAAAHGRRDDDPVVDAARLALRGRPARDAVRSTPRARRHSFTLLVPGRHEEEVMGQTLDRARRAGPPRLRDHRDRRPRRPRHRARSSARPPRGTPTSSGSSSTTACPKNKPKALNRALPDRRAATSSACSTPRTRCTRDLLTPRRLALHRDRRRRRPGRRAADELPVELVVAAQRARVLLLVPLAPALPRAVASSSRSAATPSSCTRGRCSTGRRLGRRVPRRGLRARRPTVQRRARRSSSPTAPSRHPRGDAADAAVALQAAHALEPGLPAGAAARASGASCRRSGSACSPATCCRCRSSRPPPAS